MSKIHDIKYLFINKNDEELYNQTVNLRFEEFHKNYNRTREHIFDEAEEAAIKIAAVIGDKVVGHARAFVNHDNVAEVTQVVIHHEYRGQNIGFEMMTTLLNRLREEKVHSAQLDARMYAVNFYKKLGFKGISSIFISKKSHLPHIRMEIIFRI